MTVAGHVSPPDEHALVAAALLRLGSDTRAARLFHEFVLPSIAAGGNLGRVPEQLAEALGIPAGERQRRVADARREAAAALARTRAGGLALTTILDSIYPPLLRQIPDPPIVFWHSGGEEVLSRAAVAIVGSREASASGLATARRLALGLAKAGLVVVSGLARGIDAAAHAGTLEGGGTTVAVLGNGVDVVYPRQHASLSGRVRQSGCLFSELPPGTPPRPRHFPLRNRLISGLCRGVVVVEASERSGSLITARMALEQGRDVLAVPGSVVSGCHKGCHALIKDGARLVENVEDVLEEIRWTSPEPLPSTGSNPKKDSGLLAEMRSGEPVTIDELAIRTGCQVQALLVEIGRLEVDGRVARMAGGMFVRLD